MLQNVFQSFFVTAEKPQLGLAVTVAAGVTNMALDFVLVGVLQLGVVGAATATALSEAVGGLTPLFYFSRKNSSLLHLVPAKPEARPLLKTFANGSSEFMTNFSISLVNMLYNYQLMRLTGEDGVAAYGVIMYVNFIFVSIFLGYSIGSAPIISFNYGSGNSAELKNVFRKSLKAVGTVALVLTVLSQCAAPLLAKIFVGYDAALFTMTSRGFRLFALSYLICWVNIYGSSFFTALNNGAVSALISFLRTLLFQVAAVLILPLLLGLDGVWLAIVCAELLASSVTISCLVKFKARYNYG
jgi:Na+-driven multidrug efflux pump